MSFILLALGDARRLQTQGHCQRFGPECIINIVRQRFKKYQH